MLGADVLVAQALGFFRRIGQHALALVRKRQIDGGRDLLANGGVRFDLLADRFHRGVRAQEAVGQGLVLAQQAKQQVLGLDIGRAELAGLISREEDHAPCLLRIAFEHGVLPCTIAGYRLEWPSGSSFPASAQPARALLLTSPPEAPWKMLSCPEQLFWMVASLPSARSVPGGLCCLETSILPLQPGRADAASSKLPTD